MSAERRVVLMICDGHRNDFVRPDTCPNIHAFGQRSRRFMRHRAIFPSATRASATSIATGCWPANHGLHGNTMGLPDGDGHRVHDVGDPAFVGKLRSAFGRTLEVPTMAQRLAAHGGAVIASNVSPGAAYFQDPDHYGHVVHRAGSFGPGGSVLGLDEAPVVSHDYAGDEALAEWFATEVLTRRRPRLSVLWLANPDLGMHAAPLGSPTHLEAIACADRAFARVEAAVEALRSEGEDVLFLVGSDHGQESVRERVAVAARLVEAGLKDGPDSTDVVIAPQGGSGLLYVADRARGRIPAIAAFLEAQPYIEEVFTGNEMLAIGQRPGNGLAIVFAMARSAEPNPFGVPGLMTLCVSDEKPGKPEGHGSHGGLGDFECHPFLIANGGGFAAGTLEHGVSRLIDIAPTVMRFLGLPRDGMDGLPLPQD
ncbi:MAG TPA: alkaline phosphatase family protein [Devosia sp.]|uniref:alkaline phosphatase family protein n=1 Tax=Devosia sp. TaxID=1871048 RepID=UPI002DDD6181|nr:alkaline phosphatase family protein [Devosia sp.]HEV2518326.1 alkaline phosphatase family protein [Devosia sp.]